MNHYGEVSEADAYLLAQGREAWGTLTPDRKAAALFRASLYIDAVYGSRFPGRRKTGINQPLAWPRIGGTLPDGSDAAAHDVPMPIRWATYEIAAREAEVPGSVIRDFDPATAIKSETVGPISVTYALPEQGGAPVGIPVVEGLLGQILFGAQPRFMPTVV